MLEPRYEKMLQDVAAESMDYIADTTARCIMNSVPVPHEVLEKKLLDNMIEVCSDILNEELKSRRSTPHKFADGTEVTFVNVGTVDTAPLRNESLVKWAKRVWNDLTNGRGE
jgi:hypothetical protein